MAKIKILMDVLNMVRHIFRGDRRDDFVWGWADFAKYHMPNSIPLLLEISTKGLEIQNWAITAVFFTTFKS